MVQFSMVNNLTSKNVQLSTVSEVNTYQQGVPFLRRPGLG